MLLETLSLSVFSVFALSVCSAAEKKNIGIAFKNKFLRIIAAIISFTVLCCECILTVFCERENSETVRVIIAVIALALLCVLYFWLRILLKNIQSMHNCKKK